MLLPHCGRPVALFGVLIAMIGITYSAHATEERLRAVRPGVMCVSADALAKLTLPDGSSRSERPGATADDKAVAAAGGCHPFEPGTEVHLVHMRRQTSIVIADIAGGPGPSSYFVANVDFTVAHGPEPEQTVTSDRLTLRFNVALARTCHYHANRGHGDEPGFFCHVSHPMTIEVGSEDPLLPRSIRCSAAPTIALYDDGSLRGCRILEDTRFTFQDTYQSGWPKSPGDCRRDMFLLPGNDSSSCMPRDPGFDE